jgi:hypothetical protein
VVLKVVGSDGEKMYGQQLRVVSFPSNQRAKLFPTAHAVYGKGAALRACGVHTDLILQQAVIGVAGERAATIPA